MLGSPRDDALPLMGIVAALIAIVILVPLALI